MVADRKPNWTKWRLMHKVNLWQAVALSLDIDPDSVKHDYSWKAEADFFDESQEFIDRLEVLKNNLGDHPLLTPLIVNMIDPFGSNVGLGSFAEWAHSVGDWKLPGELTRLIVEPKRLESDSALVTTWTSKQLWTLLEAAYLLDGQFPPDQGLTLDRLRPHPGPSTIYSAIKDAIDLGRLPFVPSRMNDVATRRVEPRACVQWAKALPMRVPPVLLSALSAEIEVAPAAAQTIEPNPPLPGGAISMRELGTLYRLILGMAVANYKYKAGDRSGAASTIETDLQSLGLSVGDDTIRKWLGKAAKHLDYHDE